MLTLLIKLGLSEKEAKVYLAMLELAEDTAQNISKKAGVNRATTYVIMEKLMKLGLASTVERGKKTVFIAESPTELVNLLEEQKREIEVRKSQLEGEMGELMAIFNAHQDKPSVRYFEGADGLEALDRYGHDQFKKNMEITGMIPIDLIEEQFPRLRKQAVEDRVKRGIRSRMIYTHRGGKIEDSVNEDELRTGKYIPRSLMPIDETIQIYEDWGVKIYNFDPANYFGVLIQSPDLARNMQYLFEMAWKGVETIQKEAE